MKQGASRFPFVLQLLLTAAVLYIVYIDYAMRCYIELDLIGLVIQSMVAALLIGATLIACLLIGLPLRLVPRVARWWQARPLIPLAGIAAAAFLFWLSTRSGIAQTAEVEEFGNRFAAQVPNFKLVAVGWALLSFCLLHFYPQQLLEKIRRS